MLDLVEAAARNGSLAADHIPAVGSTGCSRRCMGCSVLKTRGVDRPRWTEN